jgi:hypothetical protein
MIFTGSQEATVTAPKLEHDIHALTVGSRKLPTTSVFFIKKNRRRLEAETLSLSHALTLSHGSLVSGVALTFSYGSLA